MQRALTIKILVISFLALIMLIPLTMIRGKIDERDDYRLEATQSVAKSWTGEQQLTTPILVIPYIEVIKRTDNNSNFSTSARTTLRYKFVAPSQVAIESEILTNKLMRGIYEIPVYETFINLDGQFSKTSIDKALKAISELEGLSEIKQPYLAIGLSDPRGINNVPSLNWADRNISFESGTKISNLDKGLHALLPEFVQNETADISFKFDLNIRGMEQISFIPTADIVDIALHSPWPHPEFIGAFLPNKREVTKDGFAANWRVTQFSSGVSNKLNQCQLGNCQFLAENSMGVKLTDPVDVYLQSDRSVKYGILFIGLSFIGFFLFENLKKMRIHPIQYGLVGLAIATFYMLLISLSEHINFALSYAIATLACVSLIFSYLKFVLAGVRNSLYFATGLAVLYGILYVIIQAEDFALLMGAVLVFGVLTLVMLVTRGIDWYEVGEQMTLSTPAAD